MISHDAVAALVVPLVEERGLELVEMQVAPGRRPSIRVFVDSATGVTVTECAELSRSIARRLDVGQLPIESYVLEVSSPGMQRPVWTLAHFERFLGESLRFELKDPVDEQVSFEGRIESVTGEIVGLRLADGRLLEVSVDALRSAQVSIDPWKGRRKT